MWQVTDQDPSLIDGFLVIKGLSAHHPPQRRMAVMEGFLVQSVW